MDLTSRYQVCERNVAEKDISGSRLLVPITGAVSGIFELNEMSSRIWQEIKQHDQLAPACDVLIQEIESDDSAGDSAPSGDTPYTREAFTEDFLVIAGKLEEIGAIQLEEQESVSA